jgi:hypothetical protein
LFVQRAHNIKKDSHGFVKESSGKNFKVRELVTPVDRELLDKDVIPPHASAPSQIFPLTLKGLAAWAAFSGHALPDSAPKVANNAN